MKNMKNASVEVLNKNGGLMVKVNNITVINIVPKKCTNYTIYVNGDKNRATELRPGNSIAASFAAGKPRIEVKATMVVVQYRDKILYTIPVNKSWVNDKIGVYF
jgi:hypothetical protein